MTAKSYTLHYNFEVSLSDNACFLPNSLWYTCTITVFHQQFCINIL